MPYRGSNNRPRPYHARGRGGHPIRFQHRHMGPQHAPSQWCNKCKNNVSNFEKHFEREHALKFWGYQCPHCGLFDSKLDKSFFRRHLAEHMEATDIEVCKVSVKQGYVKAVTCLYCQYKAVNQVAMAITSARCTIRWRHTTPRRVRRRSTQSNCRRYRSR